MVCGYRLTPTILRPSADGLRAGLAQPPLIVRGGEEGLTPVVEIGLAPKAPFWHSYPIFTTGLTKYPFGSIMRKRVEKA